jgi:HEAT repeat protein
MRPLLFVAALAFLAGGCGPSQPTLAGGKPIGYWVEALKDPDGKLRKTAVTKLGNVGPADPAVLPSLLDALKDSDAAVRDEAILALMKFGPGAKEAVPTLTDLRQSDPDARVREHARKALEKIGDAGSSP